MFTNGVVASVNISRDDDTPPNVGTDSRGGTPEPARQGGVTDETCSRGIRTTARVVDSNGPAPQEGSNT